MTNPPVPLLAWVATLAAQDRKAFYTDLGVAVITAQENDDPSEVERCLRQWRLTAEAMTNAELRDQLLES